MTLCQKNSRPFAALSALGKGPPKAYNESMARGWESKSVEAQIESAAGEQAKDRKPELTPEQVRMLRDKESLELSRIRVQRELAASTNPRYQQMQRKALADLESRLALLESSRTTAAGAQ